MTFVWEELKAVGLDGEMGSCLWTLDETNTAGEDNDFSISLEELGLRRLDDQPLRMWWSKWYEWKSLCFTRIVVLDNGTDDTDKDDEKKQFQIGAFSLLMNVDKLLPKCVSSNRMTVVVAFPDMKRCVLCWTTAALYLSMSKNLPTNMVVVGTMTSGNSDTSLESCMSESVVRTECGTAYEEWEAHAEPGWFMIDIVIRILENPLTSFLANEHHRPLIVIGIESEFEPSAGMFFFKTVGQLLCELKFNGAIAQNKLLISVTHHNGLLTENELVDSWKKTQNSLKEMLRGELFTEDPDVVLEETEPTNNNNEDDQPTESLVLSENSGQKEIGFMSKTIATIAAQNAKLWPVVVASARQTPHIKSASISVSSTVPVSEWMDFAMCCLTNKINNKLYGQTALESTGVSIRIRPGGIAAGNVCLEAAFTWDVLSKSLERMRSIEQPIILFKDSSEHYSRVVCGNADDEKTVLMLATGEYRAIVGGSSSEEKSDDDATAISTSITLVSSFEEVAEALCPETKVVQEENI